MAYINKKNILFSAKVTGRRAIIHCETGLPTTDIDTTSFYEFEGEIYWYDGEWHKLGEDEGGGITEETDPTVPTWAKEPEKPTYAWNELLDKPFYVKGTVSETIDTRLSGGHRVEFNKESRDYWYAVQVSEKTYTKEQLLGGTVTSTWNTWTIDSSNIVEDTPDGLCLHFEGTIDGYVWVAYTTNYQPELFDAPLPAVGVYWSSYTSAGGEEMVSVHQIDLELEDIEHLDNKFLDLLNNRDFKTLKARVDADATIIDVTSLPTENINEDVFYRLLTGSLVINQVVQNTYTVHCVETLPEIGEPATNIDQTRGNVYVNLQDGDAYGYVDDILSSALSVPKGWYPASTLLGALGCEYKGVIFNILDDPRDGAFRILFKLVIWHCQDGLWNSLESVGWSGNGASSVILNHPSNLANGECSTVKGFNTFASGFCASAEGGYTSAEGDYSHSEGCDTIAGGTYSHAEGTDASASGEASHAEGDSTIASGYAQHVQGRYNIEDTDGKYAHIVGNGDNEDNRSNAHTVDWSGIAWFAGEVYVGGTGQDDENAEKLAKPSELNTVDKVTYFDFSSGTASIMDVADTGIYCHINGNEIEINDGEYYSATASSNRVPIVAGEGVTFELDEEKQVVRVNANITDIVSAVIDELPVYNGEVTSV